MLYLLFCDYKPEKCDNGQIIAYRDAYPLVSRGLQGLRWGCQCLQGNFKEGLLPVTLTRDLFYEGLQQCTLILDFNEGLKSIVKKKTSPWGPFWGPF